MLNNISIHICQSEEEFDIAKSITIDYMEWLGIDLCFQNIDDELERFEKIYSKPEGCYIYAKYNNLVAGGVGCRKLKRSICEMKRLYVYEKFQRIGIGKILCEKIISVSKTLGYNKMRLDTISKLNKAINLYEKIGFKVIAKYRENPDPSVCYMELYLEDIQTNFKKN